MQYNTVSTTYGVWTYVCSDLVRPRHGCLLELTPANYYRYVRTHSTVLITLLG